jgi:hypothetical protein
MTWSHRVRKSTWLGNSWYGIVEFYDLQPDAPLWSVDDEAPTGDTIDELIECLEMMLAAARQAEADPWLIVNEEREEDPNGD